MIRVAVVGYGTIGKRIADAVAKQRDMVLVGIAKTKPDYAALSAARKGYRIFAPKSELERFAKAGIEVSGTIDDLVEEADIVVDATPRGVGATNRAEVYDKHDVKAVFQGGEKPSVAEVSFNALANYDEAVNKRYIRVVSCNTTAILRIVAAMRLWGLELEKLRVFIARRGADPKEYGRGPINDVVLDPPAVPSHHADDVRTVVPNLDIVTMAVAIPTTIAHIHFLHATLKDRVSRDQVVEALYRTPRIALFESRYGFKSVAQVIEWARDIGRLRGDVPENIVFLDTVDVRGRELFLVMAVHQESIVIPENIDAIRAAMGIRNAWSSIRATDESLGLVSEGKRYG